MVSYINNDTVGEPIKKGALDYIVKPFMIEELLRKIDHHNEFRYLKEQNLFFHEYFDYTMKEIKHGKKVNKIFPAITIKTNHIRIADKLAIDIGKHYAYSMIFVSLKNDGWDKKISQLGRNNMAYILDIDDIKKSEKETLFKLLDDKKFIIACIDKNIETPYKTIEINSDNKLYDRDDILTIDEYIQYMVKSFQYKLPDTELSKRLGMSRKSLWEKRKKYDLFKKK